MDDQTTKTRHAEVSFQWLERCLVALDSIAPVQEARQLRVLAAEVPETHRQLILVEMIKCDMAAAADLAMRRAIDFYLDEFSDWLPAHEVPADLILEEIQLRREAGEDPSWQSYLERFPGLGSTMGRLLAVGEVTAKYDRRSPVPELAIHSRIDDFEILARLGQGGFASVYLARQESMQRLVALKATTRGSDEPQALSQLDHPNVVRVYDQRICSSPALRLLYMQYVPGGTLADCIELAALRPLEERSGKLVVSSVDRSLIVAQQTSPEASPTRAALAQQDWPTAVTWIGVQLAEGLHYAYGRGVLHRDVKPANILMSAECVPKLADFNVSVTGLAGRAGAAAHFGGSLAYMSPEQLRAADPVDEVSAEDLDNRSDLYSLGVVLWELYHGSRPWRIQGAVNNWSSAIVGQLAARREPLPQTPSAHGVGRVLDRVLRWVLAFEPDQRPRTGAELAGALRLALYPDVAERFHPSAGSYADWVTRVPVLALIVPIALVPNIAAAVFNYLYNSYQIGSNYTELWPKFVALSVFVNSILFPLGVFLAMRRLLPIARGIRESRRVDKPGDVSLDGLWQIGHYIAQISGGLWIVGGLIFPFVLAILEPDYRFADAAHFFLSLAICGGVAMTYPFFSISLVSVLYYYPLVIRNSVSDPEFDRRRAIMLRRSRRYLLLAAAVPLLALVLLVLRELSPRTVLLATIATTAICLAASFLAFQKIEDVLRQLGTVLAPKRSMARFESE